VAALRTHTAFFGRRRSLTAVWRHATFAQCLTDACLSGRAIRCRQSTDNGVTWSARQTVTTTTPYVYPAGIAATDVGPARRLEWVQLRRRRPGIHRSGRAVATAGRRRS
jgi:hypothetical protein